jgi:hypothetical protein
VFGAAALEQFAKKPREAMHRVDRLAVVIVKFVRHRVPGAEDVEAAVDQVDE